MACPVCGGSDIKVINIRFSQESDIKQLVGSPWDARNMARCNECGVLYDHRHAESDDDGAETVNCPECGSPNPGNREVCSYCESPLNPSDR